MEVQEFQGAQKQVVKIVGRLPEVNGGVDLNLGLRVAEVEESMDMYVVGNVKVSFKNHFGRVIPYCIF